MADFVFPSCFRFNCNREVNFCLICKASESQVYFAKISLYLFWGVQMGKKFRSKCLDHVQKALVTDLLPISSLDLLRSAIMLRGPLHN